MDISSIGLEGHEIAFDGGHSAVILDRDPDDAKIRLVNKDPNDDCGIEFGALDPEEALRLGQALVAAALTRLPRAESRKVQAEGRGKRRPEPASVVTDISWSWKSGPDMEDLENALEPHGIRVSEDPEWLDSDQYGYLFKSGPDLGLPPDAL